MSCLASFFICFYFYFSFPFLSCVSFQGSVFFVFNNIAIYIFFSILRPPLCFVTYFNRSFRCGPSLLWSLPRVVCVLAFSFSVFSRVFYSVRSNFFFVNFLFLFSRFIIFLSLFSASLFFNAGDFSLLFHYLCCCHWSFSSLTIKLFFFLTLIFLLLSPLLLLSYNRIIVCLLYLFIGTSVSFLCYFSLLFFLFCHFNLISALLFFSHHFVWPLPLFS